MFPKFNVDLLKLQNKNSDKEDIKKTFVFNFENGEFVFSDGKINIVDHIEAIKLWIEKVLRTKKFKHDMYKEYGIRVEDLLFNSTLPKSFIDAELQREIVDTLMNNDNIESISNFNFKKEHRTYYISFNVKTKTGTTFIQEVMF